MNFIVKTKTIYNCSLERAFKTPLLCDITKVHTGFLIMPKVVKTTNDKDWGKVGSVKNIIIGRSLFLKAGELSTDKIIERVENKYWKVEIGNFKSWILNIFKFTFEWRTTELSHNQIQVNYDYTIHAKGILFIPLQWLFANVFYKRYMNHVLENIRLIAEGNEPLKYD